MIKIKRIAAALSGAIILASCSFGTMPVGATSNPIGSKVGTSSSKTLFALIPISDGGVAEAARQAGISKISTIDVKSTSFLIFTNVTTTVTGE